MRSGTGTELSVSPKDDSALCNVMRPPRGCFAGPARQTLFPDDLSAPVLAFGLRAYGGENDAFEPGVALAAHLRQSLAAGQVQFSAQPVGTAVERLER